MKEAIVLPLSMAMSFIDENNLIDLKNEIDKLSEKYSGKELRMFKKAIITNYLSNNNLLDNFIHNYWKNGSTEKGQKKIKLYKRFFLKLNDITTVVDDLPELKESSFAYEEHLRDFLVNNISIIEDGLQIYENKKGVEYSVDEKHKRIDILAMDKENIPVVLELKRKRGYEKIIGQCQYYKNKIKEIFNVKRVRVIIITRIIDERLKIAVKDMEDYELFEYNLKVNLKKISV